MGVAVSGWPLARAVAACGQMGVVSGTALDAVLVRRLQLGDVGGHLRRAIDAFPIRAIAERVWNRYYVPSGKKSTAPFKAKPVPDARLPQTLRDLIVLSSFVEVWLAKEGHRGLVGVNLLEKIQIPTLPTLFGAMMAGVDAVLMGAGIPRFIPGALDDLAANRPASLALDVAGALPGETFATHFDPAEYAPGPIPRPQFLAIVSSSALATSLARKASGRVDGFIIEGSIAGGHNAPPRGPMQLDEAGEPIYGPRDQPDLQAFRELGLPFWLAGGYGSGEGLKAALDAGATGIQVGTPFAYCEESGILPEIKARVIAASARGEAGVFTSPVSSPTGFPFKVAQVEGSLSDPQVYEARARICDLGYLRQTYRREDGTLGYRCASEPVEDYVAKGGAVEDTVGRQCLCNGLIATVGMPQVRKDGAAEPPIVTAGDCVESVASFLPPGAATYSAADVIATILGRPSAGTHADPPPEPGGGESVRPPSGRKTAP